MSAALQYGLDTAETAVLYALVACGFYFASVGTRHFAFAAAVGFLIAPYAALLFDSTPARVGAAVLGLGLCAAAGLTYRAVSAALSTRGARQGQLLIASLATMGIGWNVAAVLFGSESKTLSPTTVPVLHVLGLRFAEQQLFVVAGGAAFIAFLLYQWRSALVGVTLQALLESRLNLSLRGVSVAAIEATATAAGFAVTGLAGLLWAADARVKPSMCTEIGVIGAVVYIVGPMIRPGPAGVILAAFGLAVVRAGLSLTLEGDWSMTAMLLLLLLALLVRGRNPVRLESA